MKKLKKIMAGIMAAAMIGSVGALNASAVYYNEELVSPGIYAFIPDAYGEEVIVDISVSDYDSTWNNYAEIVTADGTFHQLIEAYNKTIITVKDTEFPLDEINERLPEEIPDITQNEDGTYLLSFKNIGRTTGDEAYDILKEYYEIESIEEECSINVNTGERTDMLMRCFVVETQLSPEEFAEKHSEMYDVLELKSEYGWSIDSETGLNECVFQPYVLAAYYFPEKVECLYKHFKMIVDDGGNVSFGCDRGETAAEERHDLSVNIYISPEDGDLTGDYEINLYDVVEISKYMMGMNSLTEKQLKLGDVNKDDVCNLYDAIEIAKTLM